MSFNADFDDSSEVMSEINMTPLVDVMLVLLIIFMLTTPILTQAIKLDLPQAASQESRAKPETIEISVAANGALYWKNTAVSRAQLQENLRRAAHTQPQPDLRVHGDRAARYEFVAQVMADAQRAGIGHLNFVTHSEVDRSSAQ